MSVTSHPPLRVLIVDDSVFNRRSITEILSTSPDVEVVMSAADDQNVRLQNSRDDVSDPATFKEEFDVDPVPDRQLNAALDVLKSALLLENAKPVAAKP